MNSHEFAIKNISIFGDTDIFPFPIENLIFFDRTKEVEEILKYIDADFLKFSNEYPIEKQSACIPTGNLGFRWATQIDPIWNAYLLSCVIKIAPEIEVFRLAKSKNVIHSYRFDANEEKCTLFDKKYGWRSFIEQSQLISDSNDYPFVVKIDISDFYTRIYHHRLENNLKRLAPGNDAVKKIVTILQGLAGNTSYGLPVGGNAARLLAEALLTSFDNYLNTKRVKFVRFVDDFVLFAKSEGDAHRILSQSAEFLLKNEGLSLQKSKTQILSNSEYSSQVKNLLGLADSTNEDDIKKAKFLSLNLYFDPYSPTAKDDYDELKRKLDGFDILDLLRIELRKSKLHFALGRQLLNAITLLESEKLGLALLMIIDNVKLFYPIFPQVMMTFSKCLLDAPLIDQEKIIERICSLVDENSYITSPDNNLAFVARLLSKSSLEIAEQTIDSIYTKSTSPIVRVNCVYSMINLRKHHWLSNHRQSFLIMPRNERIACIVASYVLGDEGSHWREYWKSSFSKIELVARDWAANNVTTKKDWKIPL